MANIRMCDKCEEKEESSDEKWLSLSLSGGLLREVFPDFSFLPHWDFCPSCGAEVLASVTKIIGNNIGKT